MGVILYEHEAYGGRSIDDSGTGSGTGMPCWPTWNDCPQGGWGGIVSSIKIDPPNAYEWCGWGGQKQTGTHRCYEESIAQVHDNDWYFSRRTRKKCDHHMHRWDWECNKPSPNADHTVGTCNPRTPCWDNQKNECSIGTVDLRTNGNCKDWCKKYRSDCPLSISNYCDNLAKSNIDQMIDDDLCNTNEERIKADKCPKEPNLFPTRACQDYCNNNINSCNKSVQDYCANNMDQTCQNFCKDEKITKCTAAIRNHCFKNNGANMSTPYCKTAIVHKDMRETFDKEMLEYCNVIPNKPGTGNGRQKDLSKMAISATPGKTASEIDSTLENPICACFDEKLVQKKFSTITNEEKRNLLANNPICFLANCKNDPQAYTKKVAPGQECKITLCSIDIPGGVSVIKSENVEISNNCGPGSASNDPLAGGTGGTIQSGKPIETSSATGIKDCKKTKCDTLQDQLKSSYFNYDDLNDNNKHIFIALICLIIFLLFFIIYMS